MAIFLSVLTTWDTVRGNLDANLCNLGLLCVVRTALTLMTRLMDKVDTSK